MAVIHSGSALPTPAWQGFTLPIVNQQHIHITNRLQPAFQLDIFHIYLYIDLRGIHYFTFSASFRKDVVADNMMIVFLGSWFKFFLMLIKMVGVFHKNEIKSLQLIYIDRISHKALRNRTESSATFTIVPPIFASRHVLRSSSSEQSITP